MKFKLVTRKNMGPDQEEVPEKIYAQMVCGDYVPFDEFVEEVADSSGVGSAGVKAVIDRTVVVLVRHMQHGRRVQVGDLGHFRYNFGSEGVPDEKSFAASRRFVSFRGRRCAWLKVGRVSRRLRLAIRRKIMVAEVAVTDRRLSN